MTTQFDGIYRGLSPDVGKFRVASSGMAWKSDESDLQFSVAAGDIKWAQWLRVARNFQLRVGLKDRRRETLDGFLREDHDKVAGLLKQHFGVTLESKDISFKGWNWGVTDFQGNDLAFLVSNKTSFELPLQHVSNSNIAGRTEVSLEFTNPPVPASNKKKRGDEMVEIRFYVPGTHSKDRGSDAGSQKSDAEEDGEEISAAQAFHDAVKEKAELGQVAGDLILSFEEVLVLTPRGRYDVDMFPDFLRLRGKTYDYKIVYSSISRLFLLPKDDLHVLFIIALSTPIRQGQTRYQYLVTQFSREEEMSAELNISEEEVAKYEKLKKHYDDPTFEVVSSVFRALVGKKIIGAGNFLSRTGQPGIKANQKAVQGDLFLLEKCLFFVSKQPVLVDLADIHQAVFSRVGSGLGASAVRTFDLKIITKSGPEYTFTSINKEEHEPTEAYLKEKKVRVKNEMMQDVDIAGAALLDDDDEEMQSVASSGEEAPRPRMGGEDEDSEEDEDFQASGSDSGSPSESDSDSSGGKTASDASGDREIFKKKKVLTKKKPKDSASAGGGSDDEGGEPAEKPRKKPAPKKKKPAAADGDAMEVDVDGDGDAAAKPKAKPKPKAKAPAKAKEDEDGPAKKKLKTSEA